MAIDDETVETMVDFIFGGSKITGDDECSMKVMPASWKESYNKPGQCIKKQRHHFANKGPSSQRYGFSSSYVQMWELDHKEGWALKIWCFQTVVLEKTLRIPWTARRSNQSILKEPSLNIHWKDWCWSANTLATWCEEPTHWKRPWRWERWKAKEGSGKGWDG